MTLIDRLIIKLFGSNEPKFKRLDGQWYKGRAIELMQETHPHGETYYYWAYHGIQLSKKCVSRFEAEVHFGAWDDSRLELADHA
jgi:hypothetical protein